MLNTVPAAEIGLPASNPSQPSRRGFLHGLRQLTALPLIGGAVTLIGKPQASAEPISEDLIHSYKAWLHYEHRMLSYEMAGHNRELAEKLEGSFWLDNPGGHWHFRREFMKGPRTGWEYAEQPSTRAALVLSAVGCDWKSRGGEL